MRARLLTLAIAAIPVSIGMGFTVQAMFPAMSGNTAGLVAGAITIPFLLIVVATWMDE